MDGCDWNWRFTLIKGQPDLLFNGVPWNWKTSGADGQLTQIRYIGIWAAPLTSAFVLILPCIYYSFYNIKQFISKHDIFNKYFFVTVLFVVSLYLTYTRQILLPYILLIIYFLDH